MACALKTGAPAFAGAIGWGACQVRRYAPWPCTGRMAPFAAWRLRPAPRAPIFGSRKTLREGGFGEMTKGKTMRNILEKLRSRLNEQARFRQIRDEIAHMPLDVALDLDIYRGDADKIARKAVWG